MLIKTREDFHQYTGLVSLNKAYESYKPSIEWAMNFHMVPLMGEVLYNKLENFQVATEDSGSPSVSESVSQPDNSEEYSKLLGKARLAEACFAAFDFAQISDVHITAQGLQAIANDTHKAAYEYQKRDVRNFFAQKADAATDDMLSYMEKHKTVFTDWSGNEELYTQSTEFLINNASDFSHYCDIGNSRRTWLQLRYAMRDAVELHIKPAVGEDVYNAIIDKIKSKQPLSAKQALLARSLKPAFANLTLAEALPDMTVRISGERIMVASFFSPGDKMSEQYAEMKLSIAERRKLRGQSYLDAAVKYIKANLADFPGSPYEAGDDSQGFLLENDSNNKHYVSPFIA
jgi:hypothetical protein